MRTIILGALAFFSLALLAFAEPPQPSRLMGHVVSIADGDSLTLLDAEKHQHKVRLEGIDAPEEHQAFGTQAKKALGDLVFDKEIRVQVTGADKYRRTLGHVYADDRWINKAMVEEGFAWHYREHSRDRDLASAELIAREKKAGLWRDPRPIAPWDFRHHPELAEAAAADRQEQSQDGTVTVYITNTGMKYHRAGCRYLSKSKIPISLEEAKKKHDACSVCKPPQ